MIKDITIKNFKSIKNLNLKCAKYNVFIGEPNSGKSNILEVLSTFSSLMYKEYGENTNNISSDFVRYESLIDLFYDHDPKSKIEIKLDDILFTLEQKIDLLNLNVYDTTSKVYKEDKEPLIGLVLKNNGQTGGTGKGNLLTARQKIPNIKYYRFKLLETYPNQEFSFLLPPHGVNLLTVIQSNPNLNKLLQNIFKPFGLKLSLRLNENKIELAKEVKGLLISYSLKLVAETFIQLMNILAAVKTNNNSTLIFEEPETHLFPYYSKLLAETISQDNNNNNQFFISTHNPYFLNSFIEKTSPDELKVSIIYFENHKTLIRTLSNNELRELLSHDDIFFNLDAYLET